MPINPAWAEAGANAAQQGIGAIMGLALEGHNDRRQLDQQRKLQNLQMEGNRSMVDYNMQKQLQMWKDTNYSAQMEQMKKAGLNPGLLYGMSGGGGTTTGSAQGNVTGTSAPTGGGEINTQMGLGIQRELLQAQKENIQADTANKKAENPNIPLTGGKIGAETENLKGDTKLKQIQTEIAQVAASVSRQTIMEQMKAWENIVAKGTAEIANITGDTAKKEQEIKNLKSEVALNSIKGALMNAQTANTNQDTKNKIQEVLESEARIKQMAQQLMIAWDQLGINSRDEGTRSGHANGLYGEDWDFLKDIIPNMLIPIGKGFKGGHTPIKGFR